MLPVLTLLLACIPPTCTEVCEKVVDECGFGSSVEVCVDRCLQVPSSKERRFDMRTCVKRADCGNLLAGDCNTANASNDSCTLGAYLVVSSECLDAGTAALRLDAETCDVHTQDDWSGLGEPQWMDGAQGGTYGYGGECTFTDNQATGVGLCGDCEVAEWPIF